MLCEAAIDQINECFNTWLSEPQKDWPKEAFKERSYSRWAANEILLRLIEEELQPPVYITGRDPLTPVDIIFEFKSEMEFYYEICINDRLRDAILIAIDTADEIGCLFV